MELTKIQIEGIREELVLLLGNIFPDYFERRKVIDLIIDDLISDINETADWSDYAENEYNGEDVRIALARIIQEAVRSKYE